MYLVELFCVLEWSKNFNMLHLSPMEFILAQLYFNNLLFFESSIHYFANNTSPYTSYPVNRMNRNSREAWWIGSFLSTLEYSLEVLPVTVGNESNAQASV